MTRLEELQQLAYESDIYLCYQPMRSGKALSASVEGWAGISIDPDRVENPAEELVVMAHELGHIYSDALYTLHTDAWFANYFERQAWAYAYRQLLPVDKLAEALRVTGDRTDEIAEDFDVPEWFVRDACAYYWGKKEGNIHACRST